MDWDALLPGTTKLLTDRFGKVGYYLGSLVVLAAAFTIILAPFMFAAIGANAAGIGFAPHTSGDYIFPLYLALILVPVGFLISSLLMSRHWRKLRKFAAELDERERELHEHDASHLEHGPHQLVTGKAIDFHVSGKAAEKQWAKIQKILTDWEANAGKGEKA